MLELRTCNALGFKKRYFNTIVPIYIYPLKRHIGLTYCTGHSKIRQKRYILDDNFLLKGCECTIWETPKVLQFIIQEHVGVRVQN